MPTTTFRVYTVEHIERAADYSVQITKEEVVSALKLTPDAASKWHEHVEDYITGNWEQIRDRSSTLSNGYDDNDIESDIESVEMEENEPA